jgi:hypothetical protein
MAAVVGCTVRPSSVPVIVDLPGRDDATPWVAASGSYVAVVWGATAAGKADVFLAVSRDSGSTFGQPVQVNQVAGDARLGGEFPPRVAIGPRTDADVPGIVVLWTTRGEATEIKAARSVDGGTTFDPPVVLQSAGAAGDRGWPAVAVDEQARLHALWLDHRGPAADRGGAGHASHQRGAQHDGVAMAQKSGLYYASAGDEITGERELAAGVCYCCKTALASGAGGELYAAWRHVYPGNLRDIAFMTSADRGRSFSAPVRVSEDGWAINGCPDDGPAIAAGSDGAVHIVWPTVVDDPTPRGALFYASTRDGSHFTPRVRVPTLGGPKPSHPQIAVGRDGRVFVAWDEAVSGERVAAAREIRLQSDRAPEFGGVVRLSPASAMYPVLAATDEGLLAVWTSGEDPSHVEVRTIFARR